MGVVGETSSDRVAPRSGGRGTRAIALGPERAAWLALLPCAAITAATVLLLGPPLSHALFRPVHLNVLPGDNEAVTPEPLEATRYLLALLGPLLLAGTIATATRRGLVVSPRWTRAASAAGQAALTTFLLVCLAAQHRSLWGVAYFNWTTLAVAGLLTVSLVLALRQAAVRGHGRTLSHDTRLRRSALLALAALATAIWLLPAVNSDASISWAFLDYDTQFPYDETLAVFNGLTPMADFNAQYASLLPYLIALSMRAFQPTLLVFTITACTLSLLALLAIYDVLRRAAGSAVLAFALFVPFMATSLFFIGGIPLIRFTPGAYFPMFPLRYGGAYLLAWLLARHVERRRTAWPLSLAAGLVVLNNFEFGVAAFGATLGALLATTVPLRRRPLLRFGASVIAGVAGAVALYALVTLVRSGSLPDVLGIGQFAQLYGVAGYSVAPIPGVLGLPLVLYATHGAAIATATVRALRREPNRVLTAMLMWAGLFGLGAAPYYVARSNSAMLPMMFSAWGLSLALLAIVVLRRMTASPMRIPSPAGLAVLFGVGLMACSLAQAPVPWAQIQRVGTRPADVALMPANWAPPSDEPGVRRFLASVADGPRRFVVRSGAPVAVFATLGHRDAEVLDVVDVVPYTGPKSIHTREQLDESLDALRAAGGNTALVPLEFADQLRDGLRRHGFAIVTPTGLRRVAAGTGELPTDAVVVEGFTKWVDTRHLRAEALRPG
jgi:hypothetical protein